MSEKKLSEKEKQLQRTGLLTINSSKEAEQPFNYSVGRYGSRFLAELRDNKRIIGVKCPKCGMVYIPPREICGPCFARMEEEVEVGPQCTLETYTIIRFPFIDPETGEAKPIPFGYGYFKFDGADTLLQHFFAIDDESKIKVGVRFEPVWRENRKGEIRDIDQFVLVE
jgi:uncharacterized OB-fold protein